MAETIAQFPTEPSPILKLPYELVGQIASALSDKSLGHLRVTNRRLHDLTLRTWKKRARRDRGGVPALEWAAKYNRPALIDYLLSTFPEVKVNGSRGSSCTNPLCIASGLGNEEAAMALVIHGADANYIPGPSSALVQAVRGFHNEIVQMLLDAGADPYVLDYGKLNILQSAARRNHVETLRVILDRTETHPESMPGVNDFTVQGLTALHMASGAGALSAAALLLEFGADINSACDRGEFETPLARAVAAPSADRVSIARFLLSRGANVEGRMAESQLETIPNFDTPLHIAVQRELPDTYALATLLITHGAALAARNRAGFTALHLALQNFSLCMMGFILDAGGDVNMLDGGGSSVLHALASWRMTDFTQPALIFLQQRNANRFLKNNVGLTPRDLALRSGWDAITIKETWGSGA